MHDVPILRMITDKARALLFAPVRLMQLPSRLVALGRELIETRARKSALSFGLAPSLQVSTSQEPVSHGNHPSILCNAIPNSASSYCFETIREALGPESRIISLDYFSRDTIVWNLLEAFAQGNQIAHHHIDASSDNIRLLRLCGVRTRVHVRDPRQVMVSWIHHLSGSGDTKTSHHTCIRCPSHGSAGASIGNWIG